jgi:Flp pilus assembly protein TadG
MVGDARFKNSGLSSSLARLAGDCNAVAAVEFALVLPILLTLYLGSFEFGQAFTISRKVTHVTSSLSDLVAQYKTIDNATMTGILDASAAVVTPYPASAVKIKLSLIKIDAAGKATIVWSDARNTTALTVGSVVTVPATVKTANTYLVTGEVHYSYTPLFGYTMTGTYDLHDNFYLRPRLSNDVKRPPNYT